MSLRRAIAPLGRRLLARRLPSARAGGVRLARAVSERHGRLAPLDGATRLVRPRMQPALGARSTRQLAREAAPEPGPAELPKIPRLPGVSDEAAKWLFDVEGPVEFIEQRPDATPPAPQQPPPPPAAEPPKRLRSEAPRAQRQEIGRRRISRSPAPASPQPSASPQGSASPPAAASAQVSAPPPPSAPEATLGARLVEGPAPSPAPPPETPPAPETPPVRAIARSGRSAPRSSPPEPEARPAPAAAPRQPVRVARRPTTSPTRPRPRLQRAPARPAAPEPAAAVRSHAAPPAARPPQPGLMRRALSALKPG